MRKGTLAGIGIGLGLSAFMAVAAATAHEDVRLSQLMNCRVAADGTASLVDAKTGRPVRVSQGITVDKARRECNIGIGGQIFSYKMI